MIKNYVLDTNVLLHDPNSIYSFEDNTICIPIYVIEEIDQFKKDMGELGINARETARNIDKLRKQGDLRKGVQLGEHGKLKVIFASSNYSDEKIIASLKHEMDDLIISAAFDLMKREESISTIVVTKDVNLRIRANALGIKAEDYNKERVEITELYTGSSELEVDYTVIQQFYKNNFIQLDQKFSPNQCVTLIAKSNKSYAALTRYDAKENKLVKIRETDKNKVWGITPRNREQEYAFELLLDESIKLVSLIGKAGTGKTLIALAAGLELVYGEYNYDKLLVSRPVIPLGKDIGFLPGSIDEKMDPWMKPIYDNLEYLITSNPVTGDGHGKNRQKGHDMMDVESFVDVEPLTYLRGRSIPKQFIIIDEAQNLTPKEVKTIITRAGEDTKIVFTGDPYQIDNPYLDSANNGLTILAQKFRNEQIAGTITLVKGERSKLAEIAANLL